MLCLEMLKLNMLINKKLYFVYILLLSLLSKSINSQCIHKVNVKYLKTDNGVLTFPDMSHTFEEPDSLTGILTNKIEPCKNYKIYISIKSKTPITEQYYNYDTVVTKHFYSNGKLKLINKEVEKGRSLVYTASYYDNGQLLFFDYPNVLTVRKVYHYYRNGKVKKEFYLWGGSCWGEFITYYSSGKLKSKERFTELTEENQKNYDYSKMNGIWEYWSEEGKLTKRLFYENDKLIKEENL